MNLSSILIWILVFITISIVLISLIYVYTDLLSQFISKKENFNDKYFTGNDSKNIRDKYDDYNDLYKKYDYEN